MSQHISRKELKQDEFRDTLAHGAEAVMTHQRAAWIVAGIVVGVLVAVFGWRFWSERQTLKASAALGGAMKVYEARIRVPGEPEQPGEVTYVEEKNKYEDAAKKFADVAKQYGRTRPGQMARYYAALSLEKLGRWDEAQKWLREVESSGDPEFAALARFNLAETYERTGKPDQAAALYRQLMEKPGVLVPKPLVMLALANNLSTRNPAEAQKLYEQIKKDYPDSAVADQADRALETLKL